MNASAAIACLCVWTHADKRIRRFDVLRHSSFVKRHPVHELIH
jgi:hypothetical protein